jgi:hypothetical protein
VTIVVVVQVGVVKIYAAVVEALMRERKEAGSKQDETQFITPKKTLCIKC